MNRNLAALRRLVLLFVVLGGYWSLDLDVARFDFSQGELCHVFIQKGIFRVLGDTATIVG